MEPFGLAEAHFKVIGMYCLTCKSVVEKQLKVKSGIQRIDVD
jgi:Cu+-exporting ATPase